MDVNFERDFKIDVTINSSTRKDETAFLTEKRQFRKNSAR